MKNPDDANETMDPDLLTKRLLREKKQWPRAVFFAGCFALAILALNHNVPMVGILASILIFIAHTQTLHWLLIARNEVSELREKIEALSAAQGGD